jgi:methylated-DNA-[protein]-cysteine S-methyltransferase
MKTIYIKNDIGVLQITGSVNGVERIRIDENDSYEKSIVPEYLKKCVQEIKEYIQGTRTDFTFMMNPKGTDFQKKIWRIINEVSFGKTATYLQIARIYGDTKAVRAVAAAIGKNPILVSIPCHRIIGSNGKLVGYAAGLHKKKWLLKNEGFSFQSEFSF